MAKYDTETKLLLAICHKANPKSKLDFADFVVFCGFQIDRVGSLLEFLGLAEESGKCDLGWVPNRRLMSLIAEQVVHPPQQDGKIDVSEDDRDFVATIYNLAKATPNETDGEGIIHFCYNVLAAFGLLEKGEGQDGDLAFKPTPRMKDLVLKRLLQRAVKEMDDEA